MSLMISSKAFGGKGRCLANGGKGCYARRVRSISRSSSESDQCLFNLQKQFDGLADETEETNVFDDDYYRFIPINEYFNRLESDYSYFLLLVTHNNSINVHVKYIGYYVTKVQHLNILTCQKRI